MKEVAFLSLWAAAMMSRSPLYQSRGWERAKPNGTHLAKKKKLRKIAQASKRRNRS